MHYKSCEICGYRSARHNNEKRLFMAKFPSDEARCKLWVKLVGKKALAYMPIKKLHMNKYVCKKHFSDKDFNRKKTQLNKSAIPCLCLERRPLKDYILMNFPIHEEKKVVAMDINVDSTLKIFAEHNYFNSWTFAETPYCLACSCSVCKEDRARKVYSRVVENTNFVPEPDNEVTVTTLEEETNDVSVV